MVRALWTLGAAALVGGAVAADSIKCDKDNHCPKEKPCCSQYGECGIGAFCLGGCDPLMSHSLDSCTPAPVCVDKKYDMGDAKKQAEISEYLGDASEYDWVYQGRPLINDGTTLLTMKPESAGTVFATTNYMWYGNVKAKLKTSRGRGVVTAFILLSDVKDEIDYEFVGVDLEVAQTNYYWQAVLDWTNSDNLTTTDTFHDYHNYEIDWTPDEVTWLIDGKAGRTLKREDTWNETLQAFMYPQTPSRVQLSIWPAGDPDNPEGTINWAGGVIDWESEDIKKHGYDYATVAEVEVKCWKADGRLGSNDGKSFTYTDDKGTNTSVAVGDDDTVLASFKGTGTDMDAGASSASSSSSSSATKTSSADDSAATIPENDSGGVGSSGKNGGNTDKDAGSGSGGDDSGSNTDSGSGATCTGFQQNGCGSGSDSDDNSDENDDSAGVRGLTNMVGVTLGAVLAVAFGMVL